MKITNIRNWAVALACACTIPLASNVSALTVGDANYVGQIVNGAPSSAEDQRDYINILITLAAGATAVQLPDASGETYDRVGSTHAGPFAQAQASGETREDPTDGSIDATGYKYVYAKYGGEAFVWFDADGFDGVITVPTQALSHLSIMNQTTSNVPDGGSALLLLGGAFAALGFLRRKLS